MTDVPDPPWWRAQGRARARDKRPLTRELIVDAALALLERDGLQGLSMRRLAQELGSGAASLYWHVGDKEELLSLLLDRIVGEAAGARARPGELAGHGQGARPRHAPAPLASAATPRSSRSAASRPARTRCRSSSATWRVLAASTLPPQVIAYAADMFALYVGAFAYEESLRSEEQATPGADRRVLRARCRPSSSRRSRGSPTTSSPATSTRASSSRSNCSSADSKRWARQLSVAVRRASDVGVVEPPTGSVLTSTRLDAVQVAGHARRGRAVAARREERRRRLGRVARPLRARPCRSCPPAAAAGRWRPASRCRRETSSSAEACGSVDWKSIVRAAGAAEHQRADAMPAATSAQASAPSAGRGSASAPPPNERRCRASAPARARSGLPADASSAASRSTSAMIRAFSAGGGSIGGGETGSASAATRSSSTSARQAGQVARCAS